jgi:hypothetical protein
MEFASRRGGWIWIPKGVFEDPDNVVRVIQEELTVLNKREYLRLGATPQPVERVSQT